MAIRPYAGNATRRGQSDTRMRSAGAAAFGNEIALPSGFPMAPFGGGLFGGRDPFAEFGADPFGGGFGMGGSIMKQFDEMSKGMMQGFGAAGPGRAGGGLLPGGNGQYACQTFAMSSVAGPDGKMHTERYVSSDIGNRGQGIRESQQSYSNSSTGIDKMGLERQLGDRARKMVKERDRFSQEERSTELFRGMDDSGRNAFDRDFGANAHHLPPHPRFNRDAIQSALAGQGGGGVANTLGDGGRPMLGDAGMGRGRSLPVGRRR